MNHSARYALTILLLVFFISPVVALARRTSNSQLYQDGSALPISTRQEQMQTYRRQSSELQQKITALGDVVTTAVPMPVLFGVGIKDIFPNFGIVRPSGRTHEGEDIMAVKGTPIVSPTAAVVIRTDYGPGEGNAVYTANPGGETFVYYHLDSIGEGVISGLVLAKGSLIGYVGNTGSASTTAAHLHFEIHDSSGTPLDPFLRLTSEFSIEEKISYLTTILSQTTDSTALSRLLVTNFRGTFIAALAANVALPLSIIDAMAFVPVSTVPVNTGVSLPLGDLDIGSSGSLVVALQEYLIQTDSGAGATRLAGAGATGYFGTITKAALVEYQVAVGISPPDGYYGIITRTFIETHPLGSSNPSVPVGVITRDLYYGVVGEDVITLQKLLNAKGYIISLTGNGSLGNETNYFGLLTKAAVIKFQVAHNISPAVGYVGPLTRASLLLP